MITAYTIITSIIAAKRRDLQVPEICQNVKMLRRK